MWKIGPLKNQDNKIKEPLILNMQRQTLLKLILLFLFFEFPAFILKAQDDCALILDKAQKQYENGIIEEIPQLLAPCLQQGFSPTERIQAFKLIILANLFDQNIEDAEKNMLNFLKNYPEYQVSSTDPAEFVQLFKSYRVLRILSMGVSIGGDLTFPMVNESFVTNGQDIKGKYSPKIGVYSGIKLIFYLATRMELNVEGYYLTNSFQHTLIQPGLQKLNSTETQQKIELPISLTFDFGRNKIRPYLRAGFSIDYMLSASSKNDMYIYSQNKDITGSDINILPRRRQLNYNIVFGAGLKYKIPRGYVLLDLRWREGLYNQVLSGGRLNTTETFKYQSPDDNFTLNNLAFSVAYIHSFFKTKKKK